MQAQTQSLSDLLLACGKTLTVQHGRHQGLTLEGPEYETIYAFGGLCMVDEIEEIIFLMINAIA